MVNREIEIPDFEIVDVPKRARGRGRPPNPAVARLAQMAPSLPAGKAIKVSTDQFGWKQQKSLGNNLMMALRKKGVTVRTISNEDGVFVIPVNGNGSKA